MDNKTSPIEENKNSFTRIRKLRLLNVNQIDAQEITDRLIVGRGSFGTVYKAKWNDKEVAVKEFDVLTDKKAIEIEIQQHSLLKHQNIIVLFGVMIIKTTVSLVMEYADCGSLYNLLHGPHQPKYTAAHAMSWARQCAEGVAYMHGMIPPVIHRDLKPPNLLLFNCGRSLKICDFGTAANKRTQMTNSKGSAAWMAPEVFSTSDYGEHCDVFSWGIILWEVLTRQVPFANMQNANTLSILWRIYKGDRPDLNHFIGCPQPIEALIKQCWDSEPCKRPSMKQVVELMRSLCSHLPGSDEPIDCNPDNSNASEQEYTLESLNDDNLSTISNNEPVYENLPNPLQDEISSTRNSSGEYTLMNSFSETNYSADYPSSIFKDLIGLEIESPNWLTINKNKRDSANSRKYNINKDLSQSTSEQYSQNSPNHNNNLILDTKSQLPETIQETNTTHVQYDVKNEDARIIDYLPTTMTQEEIRARNEAIRNDILNRTRTKPLQSLSVEIDPNAWELKNEDDTDFYSKLSKNDGKERLMITETTKLSHNDDDTALTRTSTVTSQYQTNDIGDGGGGGGGDDVNSTICTTNESDNDSNEGDDTDESYHLMLDSELQPEAPDPNDKLSQKIFREHKKLAKEYLQVDEQLYYANDEKQKLLDAMEPNQRNHKLQLIKKVAEKQELSELHQYLQQQLQELREMQRLGMLQQQELQLQQQNHQQYLLQQHQQQLQRHQYQRQPSSPSGDSTDENGWVFIPKDRNSSDQIENHQQQS